MRAATPGTILILAACILLALVTCSVPVIKSIAFLTATVGGSGNENGQQIRLGCLGYCLENSCVGPTIGYSFDPTQLLGLATSVEGVSINTSQYSSTVIKALTYALVLHPIALAAAVLTLLFGILAHCGDMSLRCLNSVFASIASLITLIAVGCDFALFIIAKKRINAINGASATLGPALWMTLIAWILIILSSFTFCCSCCGSGGRGSGRKNKMRDENDDDAWKGGLGTNGRSGGGNNYADQMRMDALDAEADRKRRNKADLPKFATYETEHVESLPLKHDYEDQAGAAGFGANGGPGGRSNGQGYENQYGYYGNEYDQGGPEQHGYGYGYADGAHGQQYPSESYIPGVGPGAQRAIPAATAYYDGSQGPSTYPGYEDTGSVYSHSNSHRAPSMVSGMIRGGDGYIGHAVPPPVPPLPPKSAESISHRLEPEYGYADAGHQEYPTSRQGHAVDYSGATFGGAGGDATAADPYAAVQQATAAGRSRILPQAPSRNMSRASGIIYSPTSPTSPGGGSIRSKGVSGDDGFGLAVLQAGQAAAANVSPPQAPPARVTSPATYDDRSREGRSRPLPPAPASNQQGEEESFWHTDEWDSSHNQAPPPGYEMEGHHPSSSAHQKR